MLNNPIIDTLRSAYLFKSFGKILYTISSTAESEGGLAISVINITDEKKSESYCTAMMSANVMRIALASVVAARDGGGLDRCRLVNSTIADPQSQSFVRDHRC